MAFLDFLIIANGVNWKLALKNSDRITIGKHTLVCVDQESDYGDSKPPQLDGTICV